MCIRDSDPTQWRDSDDDNFGDNWGNPEWNETRNPDWPGIFLENATNADMCPDEVPDGRFDDDINYPGCLLEEPSDGGKKDTTNDNLQSSDEGLDTMTIVGIIGGVVVLALVGSIVVLMKKGSKPPQQRKKTPALTPAPDAAPSDSEGQTSDEMDENTVASWEGLPAGDYLDPDESGTIWFRANDGTNWYQNADGSWTKWQG